MKSNTVLTITTAVGNAALLAGLVFLIFELRQNSSIAKSQIRQERVSGLIEQFSSNARDGVLSDLYYDVFIEGQFDLLKGTNKAKLYQFEIARFHRLEDVYFQYSNGLIDYQPYRFSMERAANRLPFWEFLKINVATRNEDLARDLEELIKSPDYNPSDWRKKFIAWEKSRG